MNSATNQADLLETAADVLEDTCRMFRVDPTFAWKNPEAVKAMAGVDRDGTPLPNTLRLPEWREMILSARRALIDLGA